MKKITKERYENAHAALHSVAGFHYITSPGVGAMRNPCSVRITSRPSRASSSWEANRFDNAPMITSGFGGWILMRTIPAYFFGGYATVFTKSLSCVISIRHSFSHTSMIVASDAPLDTWTASPNFERNLATSFRTFSSTRNRMSLRDKRSANFGQLSGELQCGGYVFLCKSRVCTENIIYRFSCGKHLKYLPYHDARVFENRLTVADGRFRSDVCGEVSHMT